MRFLKLLLIVAAVTALGATARAQGTQTQIFDTALGQVKITPIYHASAMIEGGGKVIFIDPAKPAKYDSFPKADLILITHEHSDHVDADQASIKVLSKPGTQIWTTETVQRTIVHQASVMHNGNVRKFGGWTIEAVPAYNMPGPEQSFHRKGIGNGYVLSYGGKKFYFSGDTQAVPELRALKNIDVAFICMNQPYTMTPSEAADLVKSIHPKIVIPYHYRGTPSTDLNAFSSMLQGTGIEVRLLNWYAT